MNQLKELIDKYHIFILPIVSIVIGIGLLVVIAQQALKIPQTNDEIGQNKQTLATVTQKISDLDSIDLDKYRQDLKSALVALPADQDIPGTLSQLQGFLKLSGLNLDGLGFSGLDQKISGTGSFLAKVSTTGSRAGLDNFITNLKQSSRIMKIDTLSASGNRSNDSLEILLSINSYFLPSSAQTFVADQPLNRPDQKNFQTLETIKGTIEKNKQLFAALQATASGAPSAFSNPDRDPFK